jgi:two-component system, OmpR family, sensor kinase
MTLSWYKSLYWRVALGLIAFLALMLAAEAALFLWTTDRIAGSMPARSPRRLAVLIASDLGTAIAADPKLEIEKYVREQYGNVLQTFLVIMRDGRVTANHDDVPQEYLLAARAAASNPRTFEPRFGRRGGFGPGEGEPDRRFGRGPGRRPDSLDRGPNPDRRDGADPGPPLFGGGSPPDEGPGSRGYGPTEWALIVIAGMPQGRVAVLPGPTYQDIVREFGPSMGLLAGSVLTVGAVAIALVVFGPTRRRLKQVQDATERLGAGDPTARAPEEGGDEVSALARSFNRMADELTNRARALESSDRARRQLLADVSHELMTPLTAMRGYIETLAMPDLTLDATTRERYVGIIEDETHRMERIIGDLLDLARLEGGGTTMRRDRVLMAMLFDRVASRHEREMAERRVRLTNHIDAGAQHVIGDPDRLEQALQNLAANALRHTPDGGEIQLAARSDNGRVHISVRDTGTGIAGEHLPFIFDRFYKVDASRKAAGGSGLGLSIVRAIVERHGGTIRAANHPDRGAVFTITLPGSPS